MLTFATTSSTASFRYVSPGCSWYEHHMLGGCERHRPHPKCLRSMFAHEPSQLQVVRNRRTSHPAQRRLKQELHSHKERRALNRTAILIPFRGPATNASFAGLCEHLPAHLSRHGSEFHLLAVNQADPHPFNRAALANAALSVLLAGGRRAGLRIGDRRPFACLAVHDVDRFPVSGSRNQTCARVTAQYYS